MKNIPKIALLMLLLTSVDLSFAASYPGQVPVTGEISIKPGSGSGVAWPTPRFVTGSGVAANCVTDKLTGLMWVRDLNTVVIKSGANGSGTTLQNALDSVKQANDNQEYCGYKDWRLPNIVELKSLVNYGQSKPTQWLNGSGVFANVRANIYWSSTSYAPNTVNAWAVNFGDGDVNAKNEVNDYYVWPVRRAQ